MRKTNEAVLVTDTDAETADDPGWEPLTVASTLNLSICPFCSAVVPDLLPHRRSHGEFHAALRRAVTP
jgi:hypothetical protein